MTYFGIIQVDDKRLWGQWHSGRTDTKFFTGLFKTRELCEKYMNVKLEECNLDPNTYAINTLIFPIEEEGNDAEMTWSKMKRMLVTYHSVEEIHQWYNE